MNVMSGRYGNLATASKRHRVVLPVLGVVKRHASGVCRVVNAGISLVYTCDNIHINEKH